MIRLAIIGLGSIGGAVLARLEEKPIAGIEVAGVCDLARPSGEVAAVISRRSIPFMHRAEEIPACRPDYVLEAASVEVPRKYLLFFLERGISFIILSTGGLLGGGLYRQAARLCRPGGPRLIIPSGAIGGLDIVRAAGMGELKRVHIRTTKPATALPQGEESREDSEGRTILYRGPASGAIELFPRNINVAMALSLYGLGAELTTVEIIADPSLAENVHQITVEGDFGRADITLRNRPSPSNPRTSYLAVLSVLATLDQLAENPSPGG